MILTRNLPLCALLLYFAAGLANAEPEGDGSVLPRPPAPFAGKLAVTEKDSVPVFPEPVQAPEGAPDILLVMTDDVGFASSSTFGGSIPTPNLDKLAGQGLRYNRFHTTAICSPTRAALLTGRNHHAVGLGNLTDLPSPYPGYTARIAPTAATVARILRDNGYNTAMFGKDHNVPADERSPSGPFDQWPTGRGFEYFYGFIAGDSDQWRPSLYEGISPVSNPDRPEGYLLDTELADRAIHWIHSQKASAPDKPFFVYYAPGSAHAPHQAPRDWIARFHGKFDHGWDREREIILQRQKAQGLVPADTVLAPRPQEVPAWDSLSANQKKVYARFMEVYAAQLAYQDAQFGRIMAELERMGIADNTLVVFIEGDNGSSAEGGPTGSINEMADLSSGRHSIDIDWLADNPDVLGGTGTYQGYQAGWALATGTPFPWFKQLASHLGAVRNGLVVSWPRRIADRGKVRTQYHHVIDVMPTLLEAAGVPAPAEVDGIAQQPIDGASMLYSFDRGDAASPRTTQYYEMHANRAIYHDGWLASTTPRNMPWGMPSGKASDVTSYGWELYNLKEDFSQANNLAAQNPQKLEELQSLFDAEARKYSVYPLHDTGGQQRAVRMMTGSGKPFRTRFVYWGKDIRLQMRAAPPIFNLPFSLEAELDIPEQGGQGVIYAAGSHFGGWSFYLDHGRPVAYASVSPLAIPGMASRVAAGKALSSGSHQVRFDFAMAGDGGTVTIAVDGQQVASGPIARRPPVAAGNGETFDTGRDSNVPVSPDYQREGVFNGDIRRIQIDVRPGASGVAPDGH